MWAWLDHVHCKCVHVKMLEFALLILVLYCIKRESCEQRKKEGSKSSNEQVYCNCLISDRNVGQ